MLRPAVVYDDSLAYSIQHHVSLRLRGRGGGKILFFVVGRHRSKEGVKIISSIFPRLGLKLELLNTKYMYDEETLTHTRSLVRNCHTRAPTDKTKASPRSTERHVYYWV